LTKPAGLSRRGGELLLRLLEQNRPVIAAAALEFRDLAWQAERNAYGYFEASDGHVVLAREVHALFRLALPWWLGWLAASLDLTNSSHPTEIVPARTWDIGDLWITRHRKIPVVFVRRLHLDATLQALREALEKRAGRSGG
jgi:hypothetical protein